MFKRLLDKGKIEITPVKAIAEKQKEWGGSGIIFYVKNGKGLLSHKYGTYEDRGLLTLTYNNTPLIKFHSNEYFCPTCEKLISAGYGLNMSDDYTINEMRRLFNSPFVSIENSFERLKPLLGLLRTGYYALVDVELYPTDGNGKFFWRINNTAISNKASCPIYGGDGLWSEEIPKYILPSQPPTLFNREAAEFYRKNYNYRAIAYYMGGYLCSLIDGHHKAVASALEHRPLRTLVIIKANAAWHKNKYLKESKGGISFNGVKLYKNEMITRLSKAIDSIEESIMTEEETEKYLSKVNIDFDKYEWDRDILDSERYYPDVMTLARIEWAGGITVDRLNQIINHQVLMSDDEALNLVTALSALNHPRFKEIAFHFGRSDEFVSIWTDIFKMLAKIKDEEVENFFVEYVINSEIARLDLNKVIDGYFHGKH
jgi:hypothetical protein